MIEGPWSNHVAASSGEATSLLTCYGGRGRCRIFTFNFHVLHPILAPRWPRCNNLPETATYTCCNLLSVPEPKPLPPPPPLFTIQNNKVTQMEGDTGGMNQRLRAGAGQRTLAPPKPEIRLCAGCKSDRNLDDFEQEDYDGATVLVSASSRKSVLVDASQRQSALVFPCKP